ncbi:putative immune-type receptor 12a precursor, partial [Clarias magur]
LLLETLCSLTLEAEVGDGVTIWCQRDPTISGSLIFWYKQLKDSVPHLIGCKQPSPLQKCYFFTETERIVTSVHEKNTSLTITAVNVSDTGLYYCSYMELDVMIFSTSTSLQVKVTHTSVSSAGIFILTLVCVIVILLTVLILILKHRKASRTGAESGHNK